jgi:hypothetical protein
VNARSRPTCRGSPDCVGSEVSSCEGWSLPSRLEDVVGSLALRELTFTSSGPDDRTRLKRRLTGVDIKVWDVTPSRELGRIVWLGESFGEYALGLDLTEIYGVDTNYEAERLLMDSVATYDQSVAAPLQWDTESAAVWIHAEARQDLEAVLRLVPPPKGERWQPGADARGAPGRGCRCGPAEEIPSTSSAGSPNRACRGRSYVLLAHGLRVNSPRSG